MEIFLLKRLRKRMKIKCGMKLRDEFIDLIQIKLCIKLVESIANKYLTIA